MWPHIYQEIHHHLYTGIRTSAFINYSVTKSNLSTQVQNWAPDIVFHKMSGLESRAAKNCLYVFLWCEVHMRALIELSVGSKGCEGTHCGLLHHWHWRQRKGKWRRVRDGTDWVETNQPLSEHTNYIIHLNLIKHPSKNNMKRSLKMYFLMTNPWYIYRITLTKKLEMAWEPFLCSSVML